MSEFTDFKSYDAMADQLIATMTSEQLSVCLRILAFHLADYRHRFGEIPRQDLLDLLGATEVKDKQARLLRAGMELLVGYLATVRDEWEDEDSPIH